MHGFVLDVMTGENEKNSPGNSVLRTIIEILAMDRDQRLQPRLFEEESRVR
ncbi:hypothetical protein J6590_055251 [Homalodisca vitripennis]|nr:hypothetical protein J6590_055251 [Homalodisca vitripennis]